MKRATTMLGALAVAAAGFLFAAPAAHATHDGTPTNPGGCTLVTTSSNWPGNGHYYDCGDQSALDAKSYSLPPHLKTKMADENVWVILWKRPHDADTYYGWTGNNRWQVPYRNYGATIEASQGGNDFIIVNLFERVRGHDTCSDTQFCVMTSSQLGDAYDHEVGHALDLAYGEPSKNSSTFSTARTDSFDTLNDFAESNVFPNGVPTKKNTGGSTWVTYTIPPTSDPDRNEKIVKELWPEQFDNTDEAKAELFAYAYQDYRGGLAPFDWTNPYGDDYTLTSPHPNGTKLVDLEDVYKRLEDLTKFGGSPKKYFHKLWTDDTFTP